MVIFGKFKNLRSHAKEAFVSPQGMISQFKKDAEFWGPPDLCTLFIARLIFLSENSYSLTRQRGEFFLVRSLEKKTKWFSKN